MVGGADWTAKDAQGLTPRELAERSGHRRTVLLFEEHLTAAAAGKALREAAERGDEAGVQTAITQGAAASAVDTKGRTALHLACAHNAATVRGVIDALIVSGCNVDTPDAEGTTPLHTAIAAGNLTAIKALLIHGAQVNTPDTTGGTALHHAARISATTTVARLLEERVDLLATDMNGQTALQTAEKSSECATLLSNAQDILFDAMTKEETPFDWDVFRETDGWRAWRSPAGGTLLHISAWGGGVTATTRLLSIYPELLSVVDNEGWTALHVAVRQKQNKVVAAMVASQGFYAAAQVVSEGRTALHVAASVGGDVKVLLDSGRFDLSLKDADDKTAEDVARANGHLEIADTILQYTAERNRGPTTEQCLQEWVAPHGKVDPARRLMYRAAQVSSESMCMACNTPALEVPIQRIREGTFDVLNAAILKSSRVENILLALGYAMSELCGTQDVEDALKLHEEQNILPWVARGDGGKPVLSALYFLAHSRLARLRGRANTADALCVLFAKFPGHAPWLQPTEQRAVSRQHPHRGHDTTPLQQIRSLVAAHHMKEVADTASHQPPALHAPWYFLLGNPGSGRTTCSGLLGDVLAEVSGHAVVHMTGACVEQLGVGLGEVVSREVGVGKKAVLVVDAPCVLGGVCMQAFAAAAKWIHSTVLAGTAADCEVLRAQSRPVCVVQLEDFTASELTLIWETQLARRYYTHGDAVRSLVQRRMASAVSRPGFSNAHEVTALLAQVGRHLAPGVEGECSVIEAHHILGPEPTRKNIPALDRVLSAVDAMVGIPHVKESFVSLATTAAQTYRAELLGVPAPHMALHRWFVGNPGCGKTECTAKYAGILRALNLLTVGLVYTPSQSDLETKLDDTVRIAQGSVLCIDCADALSSEVMEGITSRVHGVHDIALVVHSARPPRETTLPGAPCITKVRFTDFTDMHLLQYISVVCERDAIHVPFALKRSIANVLGKQREFCQFRNAHLVEEKLRDAVAAMWARERTRPATTTTTTPAYTLLEEDFASSRSALPGLLSALHNNGGAFQQKMLELCARMRVRHDEARPLETLARRFIFAGNPGVGRKTAAHTLAALLYTMNILARNHVTVVFATELLASFDATIARSQGAVLYVEDAGPLLHASQHPILKRLRLATGCVVVLSDTVEATKPMAGPPKGPSKGPPTAMFAQTASPVIAPQHSTSVRADYDVVVFQDWTPSRCVQVVTKMLSQGGYTLEYSKTAPSARGKPPSELAASVLESCFQALSTRAGWSNGRDVVLMFNEVERQREKRLCAHDATQPEGVTVGDVASAGETFLHLRAR